jgi:hypothetical protein
MSNLEQTTPATNTNDEAGVADKPKANFLQIRIRAELARIQATIADALRAERLNDWERGFLTDLSERIAKYGVKTQMSMAQVMTINRVLMKSAKAPAAANEAVAEAVAA